MNARCGFSVAVNRPYAGTLVHSRYYQKNKHVLEVKSKALHERRNRRKKFSIPENCFGHPIAGYSAARVACRLRQPDLTVMKVGKRKTGSATGFGAKPQGSSRGQVTLHFALAGPSRSGPPPPPQTRALKPDDARAHCRYVTHTRSDRRRGAAMAR